MRGLSFFNAISQSLDLSVISVKERIRFSFQNLMIAIVLISICLTVGGLVGLSSYAASVFIAGLVSAPVFYGFLIKRDISISGPVLYLPPLLLVALSTTLSMTGKDYYFVMEVLLIFLAPYVIYMCLTKFKGSLSVYFFSALFLIYWSFALLSSYYGKSTFISFLYQVFTNSKIFILIAAGFLLVWNSRVYLRVLVIVKYLWIPLLAAVFFQYAFPGFFDHVFPYAASRSENPFGLPSRAVGLFRHSTFLGFYAMIFSVMSLVVFFYEKKKFYIFIYLMYLVLIVASGQRNELVAAIIISALVVLGVGGKEFIFRRIVISIGALTAFCALTFFFLGDLSTAFLDSDIAAGSRAQQPRSVLYLDAISIAASEFPLGSGLGTFGSAGSYKWNMNIYYELGISSFGWFGTNVLLDTFWAQHLAEPGIVGFFAVLLTIFSIYLLILSKYFSDGHASHPVVPMAVSTFGCALIISITSPALEDPGLIWIPAILLGVSIRAAQKGVLE